jgi:hypothetical protein
VFRECMIVGDLTGETLDAFFACAVHFAGVR